MIPTNKKDLENFEAFKAANPHLFENTDISKYGKAPRGEEYISLKGIHKPKRVKPTTKEQELALEDYAKKVKAFPSRIEYVYKRPDKKPLMELAEAKKKVWDIMKELMSDQDRKFVFDQYNKPVIAGLTQYFTWQKSSPYNLDKGVWLFGPVGAGKSFLLEVFELFTTRFNLPTAFKIHNLKEIAGKCQGDGYGELYKYYQGFCAFDDVGFEDKVKHMGNSICVFTEIINTIYHRHTKSGKIALATTNLLPDQIGELYGERVEDRIKQMFTFVCLGGESKR